MVGLLTVTTTIISHWNSMMINILRVTWTSELYCLIALCKWARSERMNNSIILFRRLWLAAILSSGVITTTPATPSTAVRDQISPRHNLLQEESEQWKVCMCCQWGRRTVVSPMCPHYHSGGRTAPRWARPGAHVGKTYRTGPAASGCYSRCSSDHHHFRRWLTHSLTLTFHDSLTDPLC